MDKYVHGIQLMANSYNTKSKISNALVIDEKQKSYFNIFNKKNSDEVPFNCIDSNNSNNSSGSIHDSKEKKDTANMKNNSNVKKKKGVFRKIFDVRAGSLHDSTDANRGRFDSNSSIDSPLSFNSGFNNNSTKVSDKQQIIGLYFTTNLQIYSAYCLNLISKEKYQFYKEDLKENQFYPFL